MSVERVECPPIHDVRFKEALEIGEHGAQRHEIFEAATRRGVAAARGEHRVELDATRLIDRQPLAFDGLGGPTHPRGLREMAPGIGKAMRHRGNLGQ